MTLPQISLEEGIELGLKAYKIITAIVHAVEDAKAGKITPTQAHKQIDALQDALALNDRAADAALAAKFPASETPEPDEPAAATGYEPDPFPLK